MKTDAASAPPPPSSCWSTVCNVLISRVTALTVDGRVIRALVLERSDRRIVLKVQGGKQEVLPMDEVEVIRQNE